LIHTTLVFVQESSIIFNTK